ncbi:uncharacterized protein LOC142103373 [Mixophyes fleayi]|uniref:uncharacterized protein LOC142103373 n=1 Tax=Mixophyes fleayi TaxID=3061075 RepID=UPI003F4D8D70
MDNVPSGRYVSNELKLWVYQRVRRHLHLHYQQEAGPSSSSRGAGAISGAISPGSMNNSARRLEDVNRERRQRRRPVVEAEAEEDDLHPLPEQPLPTAQQPEQPMPTAQYQPVQAEGTGDANDNGEADPEVEGQGKRDEEWADISEAEPKSSTSASGVAESELEAGPEVVAHPGQEDNGQLVLPQVDEALGEKHMEEDDSWPPPH